MPQNIELNYLQTVAPFFDAHYSAYAFPQKTLLDLAHIQEP